MSTTESTPIYDELVEASEWTPADLRAPFDLHDVIGRSYEAALRRRQAATAKARIKSRRQGKRDVRRQPRRLP